MECHNFEECEFNGGPECRLPDGMKCPHGVKADKPAAESGTDIEQLIERLNQYSQTLIAYQMGGEFADVCMDVATALSTLQSENEKLRNSRDRWRKCAEEFSAGVNQRDNETEKLQAENEKLKRALAEMWFAYENKDGAVPHDFEEQAVELAQEILGPWGECMPKYLRRGPHKED